jgi:hypothetical protein
MMHASIRPLPARGRLLAVVLAATLLLALTLVSALAERAPAYGDGALISNPPTERRVHAFKVDGGE